MDTVQKGIVTLLKSAITGCKLALPESFDLEKAYARIQAHHLTALAYEGAVNCGIDRDMPVMRGLFQNYCRALQVSERQMHELQRIFASFEEAGIDFLPIKGCVMKSLYPKPELRLMGDADVLIRMEQYERIVPIMKSHGFDEGEESDQHFVWKSASLYLELHKALITSNTVGNYKYIEAGWPHASIQSGSRYAMDVEHTFAFLFTHFARHFSTAGIGCRHVVDLWVYLRSHPEMDQERVEEILEKMDLRKFYCNIRKLIEVWFEDGASDERTEFISDIIFNSGSWGYWCNATLTDGVQDMGESESVVRSRIKYVWRRFFPGIEFLKKMYPVLNRFPWLLPLAWCRRTVGKLLLLPAHWHWHKKQIGVLKRDAIGNRKNMLEYVGLKEWN